MRFSPIPAALALVVVLASEFSSHGANAAPQGIPSTKVDVELKEADVKNVFRMLAEAGGNKVTLDTCVHGTVDIRLQNTPLPLVYDALALKLGLVYEEQESEIVVHCAGDAGASGTANGSFGGARVSLAEKDAPLRDVVGRLALAAKIEAVDYRAALRPRVNVTLEGVRLSTAIAVLCDATGLKIALVGGHLVVAD